MTEATVPDAGIEAARRLALLRLVAGRVTAIAADAVACDATATFPAAGLDHLRRAGTLAAPLTVGLGGLGMGSHCASGSPGSAPDTAMLLRLVGRASLPLGRVFEGHMNAIRLVCRLGSGPVARQAAADARAGHLFGVWNTDPGQDPLLWDGQVLRGAKILASGAGFVTRALVTANPPGEPDAARQLLLVRLDPASRADLTAWTAQGMRASATGRVQFDGLAGADVIPIGGPGDYIAQPDFSGGAWRVLAVQLGGIDVVLDELRAGLLARGRDADPHQAARLGTALIAQQTAALWVNRAAELAEGCDRGIIERVEDAVAYVGLARLTVEAACLDAMRLAQRSIGLMAFMRPATMERVCRDLATYLRQPVPDAALTEAAAWFARHPLPGDRLADGPIVADGRDAA